MHPVPAAVIAWCRCLSCTSSAANTPGMEAGLDFADALHLAAAAECERFLTFDKRFGRSGTRLNGIPVTAP